MGRYALRRGGIGFEIFVGGESDDILRPIDYDRHTKDYLGYNFARTAMQSLKRELQQRDIEVVQFPADRNNRNRFLDNYAGLNIENVDAYLDVVPQVVGYYRPDRQLRDGVIYDFSPFFLYASFNVQLISASTKQVLYRDRVTYRSSTIPTKGTVTSLSGSNTYPADDHQFKSPQDLKKNAAIALDQLAQRIETVMREIAEKISDKK